MVDNKTPSIVLVDDNKDVLDGLATQLATHFVEGQVDIRPWQPVAEEDPKIVFDNLVDASTALVVTDYDLTMGLKGLFGLTIVGWCQKQAIPVGDFSRGNTSALPEEPNLFELRVPADDVEGAKFIASTFNGFLAIKDGLAGMPELESGFSPAGVLADLLGRPDLESQFALYMSRLGSANSSLLQRLSESAHSPKTAEEIQQVLTYVLGHLLLNAILKYPGPILSARALCAYCGTTEKESNTLHELFSTALYEGPFGENSHYYWREDVDGCLNELAKTISSDSFDDLGAFNRAVCEAAIDRDLEIHSCNRPGCGGKRGGFLCPFTMKTVCQACSVDASSWIPQGAELSRADRDFYDEWAPLLGF